IVRDDLDAVGNDALAVVSNDLYLPFRTNRLIGGLVVVHDRKIELVLAEVADYFVDVVFVPEVVRFAVLGRDVTDVGCRPARPLDRFADSSDEQVRQYARIEAAGAKHDEVGVQDGRQGWTVGVRLVRLEEDALDGRIVVRDRRLTADARAVDEIGAEGDVLQGRWQDAATDVEDLRGLDNALLEAPGDLRHRGDEEVAEGVAGELGSLLVEPIVEQASHQRLIVRQGHEAVPDIARRRD